MPEAADAGRARTRDRAKAARQPATTEDTRTLRAEQTPRRESAPKATRSPQYPDTAQLIACSLLSLPVVEYLGAAPRRIPSGSPAPSSRSKLAVPPQSGNRTARALGSHLPELQPTKLRGLPDLLDAAFVSLDGRRRSHRLDPRVVPRRRCNARVARDERSVERFREGDIDGVVGGEVVPQLPDTRQQPSMRMALHRHVDEVPQHLLSPLGQDLSPRGVPADDVRDLHVEQMGDVQCQPGGEQPGR